MADPFFLLCGGGARFDKKRFSQDIQSFRVSFYKSHQGAVTLLL
jgi:hypothetical protein